MGKTAFGASFIWLVCLIYFTQGFRSFVWTAVSYQLKDRLKLSPSVSQFVTSTAFFPWSIKPIYGILSDCIPIKGRKRIPYLVIATLLSLFPWVILGLQETIRNSRDQLMIFLLLQNLGSAMADVVIDAMIAEAARLEKAKFAGDLQSVSWMTMALGGICGSLLGGYALNNFEMENIFLLFAVLPMVQLLSCAFVKETPVYSKPSPSLLTSNGSDGLNGSVSDEDNSVTHMHKTKSLTRKKSSKQKKKKKTDRSINQTTEKDRSIPSQLLQSLKMAGYTLFKAFRQPVILRFHVCDQNSFSRRLILLLAAICGQVGLTGMLSKAQKAIGEAIRGSSPGDVLRRGD